MLASISDSLTGIDDRTSSSSVSFAVDYKRLISNVERGREDNMSALLFPSRYLRQIAKSRIGERERKGWTKEGRTGSWNSNSIGL